MKLTPWKTARFCEKMALALHAGLPLAEGIWLMSQEETGDVKPILEAVTASMDGGESLSAAMEQTGAFPPAALAMILVGQETGRLEEILRYLTDYYDAQVRTAREIKNALTYPSLLLLLMLGVIGVLLMYVLPVFDRVYGSLGSRLTGVAGGLLLAGQVLKSLLPGLLILLGLGLTAVGLWQLWPRFRQGLTNWYLSRYGDRGLLRRFHNAQFVRALAMGLGSGMEQAQALTLARELLAEIPQAAARGEACQALLNAGESLDRALLETAVLSPSQSRLLALGIRSGSGDRVLSDLACRLEEEARQTLEDRAARVEPAMVLVCAGLVGLILLSVMLPLTDILSAIG